VKYDPNGQRFDGDERGALAGLTGDFVHEMAKKLDEQIVKGWEGWEFLDEETIRERIRAQLDKPGGGDPIDIANFCAFWWNLKQED
jgi:hypothetical protein